MGGGGWGGGCVTSSRRSWHKAAARPRSCRRASTSPFHGHRSFQGPQFLDTRKDSSIGDRNETGICTKPSCDCEIGKGPRYVPNKVNMCFGPLWKKNKKSLGSPSSSNQKTTRSPHHLTRASKISFRQSAKPNHCDLEVWKPFYPVRNFRTLNFLCWA